LPELPDIELYLHALQSRIVGRRLDRVRLASPFLVRSFDPPIDHANGKKVVALRRLGKRLVWQLEGDLFLVIHLMIAGRFKWATDGADGSDKARAKIPGKVGLAAFDFENGSLILTEAGSKRRASLYLVRGAQALAEHDPGGLEVMTASAQGRKSVG
jgi:formamidopyrimidine-DNA glycosylase